MLFFFSSFNLTILQALKDAIVVTTSGAEALPFLAALVVLPASVGFLAFYTKMLNILPRKNVYYAALIPFVAFFGFFAGVLYPLSDTLHLHGLFDKVCPLLSPLIYPQRGLFDMQIPQCSGIEQYQSTSPSDQSCVCRYPHMWCLGCTAASESRRTGHFPSFMLLRSSGVQ